MKWIKLAPESLAVLRLGVSSLVMGLALTQLGNFPSHWGPNGLIGGEFLNLSPFFGTFFAFFLTLLLGFSGFFLALGFYTAISSFLCFFSLYLFHLANPLIIDELDILLRILLLIGVFLPWGNAYSLDRILRRDCKKEASSREWGDCLIWLQVFCLYFGSAWLKFLNGFDLTMGMETIFQMPGFVTPFGQWLGNKTIFSDILGNISLMIELITPLLLFIPFKRSWWRWIVIHIFWAYHLLIWFSFHTGFLGLLPFILWSAFIPSDYWRMAREKLHEYWDKKNIKVFYDGDCGFCTWSINFLQMFTILPPGWFYNGRNNPKVISLFEEKKSWVVMIDEQPYFCFDAGIELLKYSPLFFWVYYVGNIKWVNRLGNKFYSHLERNRTRYYSFLPQSSWYLPFNGLIAKNIGSVLLVIIIIFSWSRSLGIKDPLSGQLLAKVQKITGIKERWNFYGSANLYNGHWVWLGTFKNGSQYDLHNKRHDNIFRPPQKKLIPFDNHRQRLWNHNLLRKRYRSYFHRYSIVTCKKWNENNKRENSLLGLQYLWFRPKKVDGLFDRKLVFEYQCPNRF